jgi:hypothetical protein
MDPTVTGNYYNKDEADIPATKYERLSMIPWRNRKPAIWNVTIVNP